MSGFERVIDRTSRWLAAAAAAWIVAALAGCAWIDTQQRAKVYKPTAGTMADWKPVSAHDEAFWIELPGGLDAGAAREFSLPVTALADDAIQYVVWVEGKR